MTLFRVASVQLQYEEALLEKMCLWAIMMKLVLIGFDQVGNSALTIATNSKFVININMHKISISSNSKYLACASIDEKAIKNMR